MKYIWIFLITIGSLFVTSDVDAQIFGHHHHHHYNYNYIPYGYNYGYNYGYGYAYPRYYPYYYSPGPIFLDYRQIYNVPGFYYNR